MGSNAWGALLMGAEDLLQVTQTALKKIVIADLV